MTGCTKKDEPKDILSSIKEKNKIVIGVKDDSKPFGFVQNNQLKGFDIDVAKYIVSYIFKSNDESLIEFIPLKPSERITALNTGKVDILVATLSINERRKEVIDFSKPYFESGQALMVPNGSRIYAIDQLNNKPVAVVLGTTGEKTVRTFAPNAISVGAINYKEAFELLKNGAVEAILADDSLLYGIMADNPGYKILSARYTKEYYAVGVRKEKENEKLKNQIDSAIEKMKNTGALQKINSKWIPKNKIRT